MTDPKTIRRRGAAMSALALMLAPVAVHAQPEVPQGAPNADFAPAFPEQTRAPAMPATPVAVESFAVGLENPWGIAPLPDGAWLVTERPGRMRVVQPDGTVGAPLDGLPPVVDEGQGGLLDVTTAVTDGRVEIWWTYAKAVDGGFATAAAMGTLSVDGTAIEGARDIFVQSPPSPMPMHYGSRIVLDGAHVWITTGEHFGPAERVKAQLLGATYGKVIRLLRDGSIPEDNPFVAQGAPQVWTLGHRNMQGATLGPDGALWTIEHGPAGGDELNRPQRGLNYGWPEVSYGLNYDGSPVGTGQARADGFEEPVYYWDPVIAPGGMAFYSGDLFDWQGDLLIGSLNPGALVRLRLRDGLVVGEERPVTDQGRIRDVEIAPDGSVLLLVDSPEGAILRVTPG